MHNNVAGEDVSLAGRTVIRRDRGFVQISHVAIYPRVASEAGEPGLKFDRSGGACKLVIVARATINGFQLT
jgi:hypothetical protein